MKANFYPEKTGGKTVLTMWAEVSVTKSTLFSLKFINFPSEHLFAALPFCKLMHYTFCAINFSASLQVLLCTLSVLFSRFHSFVAKDKKEHENNFTVNEFSTLTLHRFFLHWHRFRAIKFEKKKLHPFRFISLCSRRNSLCNYLHCKDKSLILFRLCIFAIRFAFLLRLN